MYHILYARLIYCFLHRDNVLCTARCVNPEFPISDNYHQLVIYYVLLPK